MTEVDRTTAVLSIRPVYVDRILAGTKTIEFRRQPLPETVDTVLIWRSGKDRGIVARFTIAMQARANAGYWNTMAGTGIDGDALAAYAGGIHMPVYGIRIENLRPLPSPNRLGWSNGPQSFRYAPADWCKQLEVQR